MSQIKELLVSFEQDALLAEVKKELDGGADPAGILSQCQDALVEIGDLFGKGEMFVSDLMMAGELVKEVSALAVPLMKKEGTPSAGKVILGTVKNDIHDIGKDIVHNMLYASGFEVIDLGVDVPPEQFIAALKQHNAKVLALSCLLVSCYDSLLETVNAVKAEGLRDKVKIIIGGGPIDDNVVAYCGADAMGATAQDAVNYSREVLSK